MKKLFEYLKTLKLVSKILIGIWAFFIIMVTFVCLNALTGAFDIVLLLFCYSVFSLFFLVPAIAINQFKRSDADYDVENSSDKSWLITLLLGLFFGYLGVHRFYVGKKKSGVLYLFTFGILGIGYVVDLILIILDKFKDSNEKSIKNKSNKQSIVLTEKTQTITNEPERYSAKSIIEKVKKADSTSNSTATYSDISVPGETEKRQAIPQRKQETEERKISISSGLTLSIKPVISDDGKIIDFDFDDDYKYSSTRFSDEMIKFANKSGKEAPFVPFMQYWPSYDSMNTQQKNWYFYWRTQVRQSVYLKTDLSYIFVHIYELLSGVGWTDAEDGYNQILALWVNYREDHNKLDHYLLNWLFDFSQLHNLEYRIPDCIDMALPYQGVIRDILIDKHSTEKPLKLPFHLIDALCDYSIIGSKFYKEGHQLLMNEAIPRVIALADAAMLKKSGKGILETYGPKRTKQQSYYAFQSANCVHANKRINVSVKDYVNSAKLRSYINELVRYAENVLRELYGYRGRLRGIELNDETSTLIKSFLKKEYSVHENTPSVDKKAEVKLDFESINTLRHQSDAVRDALEVADGSTEAKELLTDLETVKIIFKSIPHYCRPLFDELHSKSWQIIYSSSTQPTIDKINEISNKYLACSILVEESNNLLLEDDYTDEFDYVYEHLNELELTNEAESETNNCSRFNFDLLSDELKQLFESLSTTQKEIVYIILNNQNINLKLEEIANAEMSMPEMLIDEINDIASQIIGDMLIDTFSGEICILEQYESDLKNALNQED